MGAAQFIDLPRTAFLFIGLSFGKFKRETFFYRIG